MEYSEIGGYRVGKLLGKGSMGSVYLAHDSQGEAVAIKIISEDLSDEKQYLQRFLREVKVACKLRHPNILPTLDYGMDFEKDILFAVMEYVQGVTIEDVLEKRHTIPIKESLLIIAQVALGLAYAQEHKLVHRDIKPANLMMDRQGLVKIVDFGLVKELEGESFTESGLAMGSPSYMSVEQVKGDPKIDSRSDVYSLGIVLFEMLAGSLPFRGKTAIDVMMMHTQKPLPSLKEYLGKEGKAVEALLKKMTAKDKKFRLTPKKLLEELRKM